MSRRIFIFYPVGWLILFIAFFIILIFNVIIGKSGPIILLWSVPYWAFITFFVINPIERRIEKGEKEK